MSLWQLQIERYAVWHTNEGIAVQQWASATGKNVDICEMYFHPYGILGATPERLLGGENILDVITLP